MTALTVSVSVSLPQVVDNKDSVTGNASTEKA